MNSIKIYSMFNINNVCVLLSMCLTHLGCMSHYRNQMDEGKGDELGVQSTSRMEGISSVSDVSEGDSIQLDEKVKKFLEKEDFEVGLPITNIEIASVN